MAGIAWNRLKMTDWMAMAGAVSALVIFIYSGYEHVQFKEPFTF